MQWVFWIFILSEYVLCDHATSPDDLDQIYLVLQSMKTMGTSILDGVFAPFQYLYLRQRLASGEGIVSLGVTLCLCVCLCLH